MAPDFTLTATNGGKSEIGRFPGKEDRGAGLLPGRIHRWLNEGNAAYQAGIAKFEGLTCRCMASVP